MSIFAAGNLTVSNLLEVHDEKRICLLCRVAMFFAEPAVRVDNCQS